MKKLSILLASILMVSSVSAKTIGVTSYESAKQKAMGGATILSEVNENALVNNPALLKEIDGWELNIFGLAASISSETPELAEGLGAMMDDIDGLDKDKIVYVLEAYLNGTDYNDGRKIYNQDKFKISNKKLVLELTNVITAYVNKGFGVGVFSSVNVNDLRLIKPGISPEIKVDIGATVQAPIGVAFDFGDKNQYIIGTTVKYIAGVNASATLEAVDLAGEDKDVEDLIESQSYSGLAVDLGTIYKSKYLNYALTVNNAFGKIEATSTINDVETTIDGAKLPTIVNVAISNKFDKKDRLDTWWDKHAFWTLELKNITNADINGDGYDDENFYKKIHLGASSHVFNNKWVRLELRGGLNQGYPTFGFGSELFSFLNLDYAYSTREAGLTVGSKPETLHTISLDFRM